MTDNLKRVKKIKRLLGLKGNDTKSEYYRVSDVLCDLKHFCNSTGIQFDAEMQKANFLYAREQEKLQND